MTRIIFFTILVISFFSLHNASKTEKEEIKAAVQKGFVDSIKKQLSSILKLSMPQKSWINKTDDYINPYLNATVITEALNNLKYILPERIPLMPFSMAESIREYNMLFYFAEFNSSFINLTNFDTEATVNNTKSNVSISANLHINSSSLDGHYELDISNYNLHLFGDGLYSIISKDTDIAISTEIEVFDDYTFLMSYFIMNITVNSSKIEMSNLLNGDPSVQPLIDFLGMTLPGDVSIINDMLLADVNNTVVQFTNSYLASVFSWDEIVWLIQNAAQQNYQ